MRDKKSLKRYLQPACQNLFSHFFRQGTQRVSLALLGVKALTTFLELSLLLSVVQKKPWRRLTLGLNVYFRCNGANCWPLNKDNFETWSSLSKQLVFHIAIAIPPPVWHGSSKPFLGSGTKWPWSNGKKEEAFLWYEFLFCQTFQLPWKTRWW